MTIYPGNNWKERCMTAVATGFGIGMIAPFAPGTFGTAPGILLARWTVTLPILHQCLIGLGMTLLAIPFCDVAERVLQKKDDGRICADEWMLFPISVIGLPLGQHIWLLPLCFVVARACDIIKPPPARQLQKLHGGFGIVIDDFFASLYALAINHGLYWLSQQPPVTRILEQIHLT